MRAALLVGCLSLCAVAAEAGKPFPLPSVDGRPLALHAGQKRFRVPGRFDTLESFYRRQLADPAVAIRRSEAGGHRVLTLSTRRPGDAWTKATVTEGEVDCTVEVQWVLRMGEQEVAGNARPQVEFILSRSAEVDRALKSIDHLER